MYIQRKRGRRIVADAEVAPEAMDLLFEAEDVAELVAEVTGDVVEVTADGDEVVFSVGEGEMAEEFTVTADGDEEILEATRRNIRGKKPVRASRRVRACGTGRVNAGEDCERPARPERPVRASRPARPVRASESKPIRKAPKR